MKKTIRNLLLTACFLFTVSYDSCTLGVSYDKKYKLSPEIDNYSCTMSKIYGQRWERLGLMTFMMGTTLVTSVVITYRRKQENKDGSILNLIEE